MHYTSRLLAMAKRKPTQKKILLLLLLCNLIVSV